MCANMPAEDFAWILGGLETTFAMVSRMAKREGRIGSPVMVVSQYLWFCGYVSCEIIYVQVNNLLPHH
jgi:hypothetical protein